MSPNLTASRMQPVKNFITAAARVRRLGVKDFITIAPRAASIKSRNSYFIVKDFIPAYSTRHDLVRVPF